MKSPGRPPVGPQVSFAIPQHAKDAGLRIAQETGRTESAVLREAVVLGLERLGHTAEREQTPGFVRPATEIIARWIGHTPDVAERRERFKAWHRVAGHPTKGVQLLNRATGELVLAGEAVPEVSPLLVERLASPAAWRVRFMWHQTTIQELAALGIGVHVDGAPDDLTALHGDAPEEDEDYA